ncbi:MAG: CHAT domain-containing protein [Anaerolineales bacterium]
MDSQEKEIRAELQAVERVLAMLDQQMAHGAIEYGQYLHLWEAQERKRAKLRAQLGLEPASDSVRPEDSARSLSADMIAARSVPQTYSPEDRQRAELQAVERVLAMLEEQVAHGTLEYGQYLRLAEAQERKRAELRGQLGLEPAPVQSRLKDPPRILPADRMGSSPTYQPVDLRIFPAPETAPHTYPIELRLPAGWPEFQREMHLDLVSLRVLAGDVAAYGRALGEAVFDLDAGGIGGPYREALAAFKAQEQGVRVRLRLPRSASDLDEVLWERIHHPVGSAWQPLAPTADVLLSRYIPTEEWRKEEGAAPYRVLVLIASPRNLEDYRLAPISSQEREMWEQLFADVSEVEATILDRERGAPVTLNQLRQALLSGAGFDVVHFVGHGAAARSGTALYFEDDAGAVQIVAAEQMVEAFRAAEHKPRLCFLAACESGSRARSDAFLPLGPKLVAEAGIPAVVAMADRVGMGTAREFTVHFYRRLIEHGVVDLAMQQARALIRERGDWSVPVLFSRLPENRLWRRM